jgi:hypothetical protein
MSPPARASRLEARRFGARLSRMVVLGTLVLGAIGCGVQNPSPGGGRELTSNLRRASASAAILLRNAHRDLEVARTIIYYRPDSQHVASFLNRKFFPGAEVEPAPQLADRIDVKIVLGHDLSLPQPAGTTQTRVGKSL